MVLSAFIWVRSKRMLGYPKPFCFPSELARIWMDVVVDGCGGSKLGSTNPSAISFPGSETVRFRQSLQK